MRERVVFESIFQDLLDAPEDSTLRCQQDPTSFEASALRDASETTPYAALFHAEALAFLLYDTKGTLISEPTHEWVPHARFFHQLIDSANKISQDGRLISIVPSKTYSSNVIYALWAPAHETANWNLPQEIRDIISPKKVEKIVLVAGGAHNKILLTTIASGYGLTGLEQRVLVSTVQTGNSKLAAKSLQISYGTARAALVQIAKRIGQKNTAAVIRTTVAASFGLFPQDLSNVKIVAVMLQITQRQAKLSVLIANGATRSEAALALGISEAVIKKDMEAIFALVQVKNATELARIITEIQALQAFSRTTKALPGFLNCTLDPVRIWTRPNSSEAVEWSDYGPVSGKPILVVHSNWACRSVPRELLHELQKMGWRPISIDRPGFGGTHIGYSTSSDPFTQAVNDTLCIMDHLGIQKFAVVARAGTHFVHMLKALAPNRVGATALVSPTLYTNESKKRVGIMGTMKEMFQDQFMIEYFFRVVCSQVTLERVEMLTRSVVKGVPVDEKLCDDPNFIHDRFRAIRPFATGNFIGGIFEQRVISKRNFEFPKIKVSDWIIFQGDQDNHNCFEDVKRYWTETLPNAPIVKVSGGGRFLTSSHPELIVRLLNRIDSGISHDAAYFSKST